MDGFQNIDLLNHWLNRCPVNRRIAFLRRLVAGLAVDTDSEVWRNALKRAFELRDLPDSTQYFKVSEEPHSKEAQL